MTRRMPVGVVHVLPCHRADLGAKRIRRGRFRSRVLTGHGTCCMMQPRSGFHPEPGPFRMPALRSRRVRRVAKPPWSKPLRFRKNRLMSDSAGQASSRTLDPVADAQRRSDALHGYPPWRRGCIPMKSVVAWKVPFAARPASVGRKHDPNRFFETIFRWQSASVLPDHAKD